MSKLNSKPELLSSADVVPPSAVPEYRGIVAESARADSVASIFGIIGALDLTIGGYLIFAAGDPGQRWLGLAVVLSAVVPFGAFVALRLLSQIALAIRDMARNSFR